MSKTNETREIEWHKTCKFKFRLDVYKKVYKKVCNSCTIYIILFAVFFVTSICISSVFIYFYWYLKSDNICVKFNSSIQTTNY